MNQIYSATYSNVPVFEFVTAEGPVMRRKLDSWINATHILKVAKFPKAKRTRILEKDVQTKTHDKVQGGYGKYQGTYVPLVLGAEIARTFGIYDVLQPIFDFEYIEGQLQTPPPAPKHSHALASNVARKLALLAEAAPARKIKSMPLPGEPPRKRGRPRRDQAPPQPQPLPPPPPPPQYHPYGPTLQRTDTAPIRSGPPPSGPNIGTFNNSKSNSVLLQVARQDTDQDALQMMVNSLNVHSTDLEEAPDSSDDDARPDTSLDDDNDALIPGRELFGSPRNLFEKIVHSHNQQQPNGYPYGLQQYHHPEMAATPTAQHQLHSPQLQLSKTGPTVYTNYFSHLLNYFLEDTNGVKQRTPTAGGDAARAGDAATLLPPPEVAALIPADILHPPTPLSRIAINQPVDNDGNLILHWACSMANTNMIEFLLEMFKEYLSPNIKNNHGETPLMFLTRFSNSFQLKNFPTLLDLLFDSILLIDNVGRGVLHHIVLSAANKSGDDLRNKEKFARYYMELLFAKVIELDPGSDLLAKVINHQDVNGNTAFHIAAYNLNKRLVRAFISYHKYIDFALKNAVGYTVEEYLASHNFVLRLGHDRDAATPRLEVMARERKPSFERELLASKTTLGHIRANALKCSEQLQELSYAIDREFAERDERMMLLYKVVKYVAAEEVQSQRDVLRFFKLEELAEGDAAVQDEVDRLVNDLTFEVLKREDDLQRRVRQYRRLAAAAQARQVRAAAERPPEAAAAAAAAPDDTATRVQLAVQLQRQILTTTTLRARVVAQQLQVPVRVDNKENAPAASVVERYPRDDRLNKYCRLIALCCGMDADEVERLIDLIELSLVRQTAAHTAAA